MPFKVPSSIAFWSYIFKVTFSKLPFWATVLRAIFQRDLSISPFKATFSKIPLWVAFRNYISSYRLKSVFLSYLLRLLLKNTCKSYLYK